MTLKNHEFNDPTGILSVCDRERVERVVALARHIGKTQGEEPIYVEMGAVLVGQVEQHNAGIEHPRVTPEDVLKILQQRADDPDAYFERFESASALFSTITPVPGMSIGGHFVTPLTPIAPGKRN